jgi:hypothetical protein
MSELGFLDAVYEALDEMPYTVELSVISDPLNNSEFSLTIRTPEHQILNSEHIGARATVDQLIKEMKLFIEKVEPLLD